MISCQISKTRKEQFDVINKQNHPSEKRKLFNEEKVFYEAKN
jgi:hypothetical protein